MLECLQPVEAPNDDRSPGAAETEKAIQDRLGHRHLGIGTYDIVKADYQVSHFLRFRILGKTNLDIEGPTGSFDLTLTSVCFTPGTADTTLSEIKGPDAKPSGGKLDSMAPRAAAHIDYLD